MKLYFAYKYSNNKDKEQLKSDLDVLDKLIRSWGHNTFILGRDIKKWQHVRFGYIKQIPVIYNNMAACDAVLIYANSPETSLGLFFELITSKIQGKKTILLHQSYDANFIRLFVSKSFRINAISDVTPEMLK